MDYVQQQKNRIQNIMITIEQLEKASIWQFTGNQPSLFKLAETLLYERNHYREIAINSEMQWRKLHGEVVPYIQRESVENYIDNLVKEHEKRPWSKLNEK